LDRVKRVDDATKLFDPSFAMDRQLQQEGMRSGLTAPLLRGEQLGGYVLVASRRPGAFTAEHEAALQPIADLLALALEHERLWSRDASRRLLAVHVARTGRRLPARRQPALRRRHVSRDDRLQRAAKRRSGGRRSGER
jgi:GAF domain-containing protein